MTYGNGDFYATFQEMFDYAVAQDETHGDGDPTSEDYTMPQCTNTTILAAVRFGWVGEARGDGAVTVTTEELPPAMEGVAYETTMAAVGGTVPYAWSVVPDFYAEEEQSGGFSLTGVEQGWRADDACWTLQLPFPFPFFGNAYSFAKVNSNGTISFGNDVSAYYYDEYLFQKTPMIAVLWRDLSTSGGDIYVEGNAEAVKVSWSGTYLGGSDVNFSVTLAADGEIRLAYGGGNETGGFIGLSAGDGETTLVSGWSENGSMDWADDIVFAPQGLPAGMELTQGGVLQGTPEELGSYDFTVMATDASGEEAMQALVLDVAANPALRPVVEGTTPEDGYVNMGTAMAKTFSVDATRVGGGTLTYSWRVDGELVDCAAASYCYTRDDDALHTLSCTVAAADLPKTVTVTWQAGVLTVDGPADTTVAMGATAVLRLDVTSSLGADVTWFDEFGADVGYGEKLLLRDIQESGTYHAVAENALGAVESRTATVTVTTAPAVGRIYKLTGAPFRGNRLVLRAKAYGNLSGATYSWKRNGVQVGTSERLDIASLGAEDFGTYTLTVTTAEGAVTSEGYELAEALSGVPVGWGADDHGRTEAPAGESGFVQVASGMNFNLGLKSDGTLVAWGYNGHGGCDVPEGLSGVSSVAAGGYESAGAGFAVRTDGTVTAWGTPHKVDGSWNWRWVDEYDEFGNWIGGHEETYWYEHTNGWDTVSTMPGDLSDVVQVAVGSQFAMALKADGTVVTWGTTDTWHYDEEEGDWVPYDAYAPPEGVEDVVAIAAGARFAVALTADGGLTAWGNEESVGRYGCLDTPDDVEDVVAIVATKGDWEDSTGFALEADGTVAKWGDKYNYTDFESGSETDALAIDAGQAFFATLDAGGVVTVWNQWNDYGICRVPGAVQGNAFSLAAGGYHCTALLADTDGDSIADAEEVLLGRDPVVWEPWQRTTVEGTVLVDGGAPEYGVTAVLLDAAGNVRGRATSDENGAWIVEGVIPGVYELKLSAPDAVDTVMAVSTLSGAVVLSIDLEPGQGTALAEIVPHETAEGEYCCETCTPVELPAGTMVYLDMRPASLDADGKLDLGEVAASHCALDGTTRQAHLVTVKCPGTGGQTRMLIR